MEALYTLNSPPVVSFNSGVLALWGSRLSEPRGSGFVDGSSCAECDLGFRV